MATFGKEHWPSDGPLRALLEYLDDIHREAGRPSFAELGRQVGLAQSTLSPFFTGRRLISQGNLHLVVEALDGDPGKAERLRKRAAAARADTPPLRASDPAPAPDPLRAYLEGLLPALERWARHEGRPRYVPEDLDLFALPRSVRIRHATDPAPVAWSEAADRYRHLVVLGDAGMGKSWLIRSETARRARTALEALGEGSEPAASELPVPVRADELAALPHDRLVEALVDRLSVWHPVPTSLRDTLAALLAEGRATLLVDALDELPGRAERGRVDHLLSHWSERIGGGLLVTSRVAGYTGPPTSSRSTVEAQLLPLGRAAVDTLIDLWGLSAPAAAALRERVANDAAVAALVEAPLMAALLCGLAEEGDDLPAQPSAVLERVVRRFLGAENRWPTTPVVEPAEVDRLISVLAPLAHAFASDPEGWRDRMSGQRILTVLRGHSKELAGAGYDPAGALRLFSVEAGMLAPAADHRPGADVPYLFVHRYFAVFLVAVHLSELSAGELIEELAEDRCLHYEWRTAWAMAGGILARQDRTATVMRMVEHLLHLPLDPFHGALFAALRILAELPDHRSVPPQVSAEAARRVTHLLTPESERSGTADFLHRWLPNLPPAVTAEVLDLARTSDDPQVVAVARRSLSMVGTDEVDTLLIERLVFGEANQDDWEVLAGRHGERPARALLEAVRDPRGVMMTSPGDALAAGAVDLVLAEILALLEHPAAISRLNAVCALRHRHTDDRVLTGLIKAATDDEEIAVRMAAAEILATAPDPRATEALRTLTADSSFTLSHWAAHLLDEAGHTAEPERSEPGTQSRADDPLSWDQQALVAAIAADDRPVAAANRLRGTDDPRIVRELLGFLSDERPYTVRAAALALGETVTAEVTHALMGLMAHPDPEVRLAVLGAAGLLNEARRPRSALAADLPDLLADPDPRIRHAALILLADLPAGPALFDPVAELLDDEDHAVRSRAQKVLAEWPASMMLDLIADRAGTARPTLLLPLYSVAQPLAVASWNTVAPERRADLRHRLAQLTREAAEFRSTTPPEPESEPEGAGTPDELAIVLLRGTNMFGDRIFTYVQISLLRIRSLMQILAKSWEFSPLDLGEVVAAGHGEPDAEVIAEFGHTKYSISFD
ncbi:HEAT repeat domain-containing protein [Streptomyces sp. NBC_00347]|uniref:HEAT repeat domain-containing protein n=1 Tax=Streptomyces sp. NBC_00347 TaxID=2975721 RepID=UPI0022545AA8|nr:HEAT repeat domain-containing protein [Streptomyces sp. NBC_00347]MCX5122717.1 HEAT repeat domain-containing protein [Streptomyces sp. NBC_00347]